MAILQQLCSGQSHLSDNHLEMSMKIVIEEIALIVFVIAVYAVLPAAIVVAWIRWVRGKAPETWLSRSSLLALGLATCSGLLAMISLVYAHAIGGFPYDDPRLLRFYRWGGVLADAGFVLGIIGCWGRNPVRWYAPLCALGMSVFWVAAAMGE
jgi:hypothetical protein